MDVWKERRKEGNTDLSRKGVHVIHTPTGAVGLLDPLRRFPIYVYTCTCVYVYVHICVCVYVHGKNDEKKV
jgi:hypothetical protein